jgi:phosphatidylglycerol---prolipoprotein diacylglyceryl transferase
MKSLTALPHVTPASFVYALAYSVGILVFCLFAQKRRLLTEGIGYIAMAGLVGGLVGANLGQFLATSGGPGKSVLGGILGGYLAVMLAKKRLGLVRPTGDLFAVALMAGEAVGRWGCFLGGCCGGQECALPWAVAGHHPTQLYLSAACAVTFVILLLAETWRRPAENGLWYLQGVLYCPARFVIEFFRDGATRHGGLSTAQWVCLIGLAFFVYKLAKEKPFATKSTTALP